MFGGNYSLKSESSPTTHSREKLNFVGIGIIIHNLSYGTKL